MFKFQQGQKHLKCTRLQTYDAQRPVGCEELKVHVVCWCQHWIAIYDIEWFISFMKLYCLGFVSGWYFGKTAGVFGTMDNEPSTDFLTSRKTMESDLGRFARSWALEPQKCASSENYALDLQQPDPEILNLCETFFKSKTSHFSCCFPVVSVHKFYNWLVPLRGMY